MKKVFKTIGIIFITIIILGVGMVIFDLANQKEVKNIKINDIDVSKLNDGKYIGKYTKSRWTNTVEVTIANHRITNIKVKEDQYANIPDFADKVFDEVIEKQSLNVDTISGATISTKAYLKAIDNALNK